MSRRHVQPDMVDTSTCPTDGANMRATKIRMPNMIRMGGVLLAFRASTPSPSHNTLFFNHLNSLCRCHARFATQRRCPLYPQKRTCAVQTVMSAVDHKRILAPGRSVELIVQPNAHAGSRLPRAIAEEEEGRCRPYQPN
jgi:hypothetical protein